MRICSPNDFAVLNDFSLPIKSLHNYDKLYIRIQTPSSNHVDRRLFQVFLSFNLMCWSNAAFKNIVILFNAVID